MKNILILFLFLSTSAIAADYSNFALPKNWPSGFLTVSYRYTYDLMTLTDHGEVDGSTSPHAVISRLNLNINNKTFFNNRHVLGNVSIKITCKNNTFVIHRYLASKLNNPGETITLTMPKGCG